MTCVLQFIDTETTGIKEDSEVVQYAIVEWRDGDTKVRAERYIFPHEHPSEEVCKINGYDNAVWESHGALRFQQSHAQELYRHLDGTYICGSNPDFDKRRLAFECSRLGMREPTWSHRSCNLASFGFLFYADGQTDGTGLSTLCEHFGIKSERRHSALGDCLMGIQVFERLAEAFIFSPKRMRAALEAVREQVRLSPPELHVEQRVLDALDNIGDLVTEVLT